MVIGKRARLLGLMMGASLLSFQGVGLAQTNGVSGPVASAPTHVQPSQPWPQTASDVPVDSAVRFGTLPNGMRYAILHNATPPNQASLLVRIDAGSLMEKDDQLGLAHFMEHMAFNGTKNIPKNEMISALERLGLAFGADLNAATNFDQTYYMLNMPKNDAESLDTGLFVLREQVSNATMDADAVDGERGVIAGEERLRNTPGQRVAKAVFPILAQGQLLAKRFPIGDLQIINTATRDRFVDFYHSYYRPSRATLVAVGDFDVDAMEANIEKHFADWQPASAEGPEPDLGVVAEHHGEVTVVIEPGTSSSLQLNWTKAPDLAPDTQAKRRQKMVEELGLAVLSRRLDELSRADNPPILSGSADDGTMMRSVRMSGVVASFVEGKWKPALEAIDREQRRFAQYGVTDAELAREIEDRRTRYERSAAGAPTRTTTSLSGGLLMSVNEREVFTTPQTNLEIFEQAVKGLTAAKVNAALKPMFAGTPIVFVVSPVPIKGGQAAVASALKTMRLAKVKPLAPPAKMTWPYTDFGPPGTVVAERELPDLGATIVTFDNGTTLIFKHTDLRKDSISINVAFGRGELAFSPDAFDRKQMLMGLLRAGGLGKMTADEFSRSMVGHSVGGNVTVRSERFYLGGDTRGKDLALEMQVLAAFLTDPAYRSNPFDKIKANYPATYEAAKTSPMSAFNMATKEVLAGGDKRQITLTPDEMSKVSLDDEARAGLKDLFAKGPLQVTMVGDTTLDEAIRVTAHTFGALPKRPAADPMPPGADQRHLPAPTAEPMLITHKGLAEQALGYIAWPGPDEVGSPVEALRGQLFAQVLKLRALDIIREELAISYSPQVGSEASDVYKGFGRITSMAVTAPEKVPVFFKAMEEIAQDLRDKPISADELKRAREPLVASYRQLASKNDFWLYQLATLIDHPENEAYILKLPSIFEAVTPADIQAMAQKYLQPGLAWKAQVLPEQLAGKASGGASAGK